MISGAKGGRLDLDHEGARVFGTEDKAVDALVVGDKRCPVEGDAGEDVGERIEGSLRDAAFLGLRELGAEVGRSGEDAGHGGREEGDA